MFPKSWTINWDDLAQQFKMKTIWIFPKDKMVIKAQRVLFVDKQSLEYTHQS